MKELTEYCFTKEFEVRDPELDMFGVVNNSVYLVYLEHARGGFVKSLGSKIIEGVKMGFIPVVTRNEIDYMAPLRSGNIFEVRLAIARVTKRRVVFIQDIYKIPEEELILKAKVTVSLIGPDGIPFMPPQVENTLKSCMPEKK